MRKRNLQLVREACIKANPEIVELQQGCFVKDFLRGTLEMLAKYEIAGETPVYDYVFRGEDEVSVARSPRGNWDILGRPIRLADVLLVIGNKYSIQGSGHFMWYGGQVDEGIGWNEVWGDGQRRVWNLHRDDLTEQSDETLSFLAGLLS